MEAWEVKVESEQNDCMETDDAADGSIVTAPTAQKSTMSQADKPRQGRITVSKVAPPPAGQAYLMHPTGSRHKAFQPSYHG